MPLNFRTNQLNQDFCKRNVRKRNHLVGYNYLSKCYFQYQSVFKTGRHQQSLDFDLGMEIGIFAQKATVGQAWETPLPEKLYYYFGGPKSSCLSYNFVFTVILNKYGN